jgi:hypothetical protein
MMDVEQLLANLEEDESGVMVTPELFAAVVELWLPQLVFIEAGQGGELYVRLMKWRKPVA